MSDALENKTVEILDKSQAAIATFADKLAEMAKQYGPDVAHGALQMARIDAAAPFMWAVPFLAIGICGVVYCIKLLRTAKSLSDAREAVLNYEGRYRMPDGVNEGIGGVIGGIVSCGVCVISAMPLLDLWRWVGIFEPKLWLAKKVLGL